MTHPLAGDLSNLTTNELEEKIIDLQRKYFMSANVDVQMQISILLDTYKQEVQHRRIIESQRQKEQQEGDSGLDNLINVS
mgnify:CR=1 FL=1